jgi:hypothetical protein
MARRIDRRIVAMMARNSAADTPEAIAARLRRTAILDKVRREMDERYPVITAENVFEALAYQARRLVDCLVESEGAR